MLNPNTLVIYVDDIPSLTHFYQNLLGKKPAESSPTFTMFHLDNLVLGLKARNTAIPPVNGKQGFELASIIDSKAKLDALHIEWQQKGVKIALEPTELPYGYCLVGQDPEGNFLRVVFQDRN